MIYISEEQLHQVEYLIEQSIQGNHVLFDPEVISKVFRSPLGSPEMFGAEEAYRVEHHFERLLSLETLVEKRAYLERLDEETHAQVVRTYFNIVENNLHEHSEVFH